jgi:hypothetical protein
MRTHIQIPEIHPANVGDRSKQGALKCPIVPGFVPISRPVSWDFMIEPGTEDRQCNRRFRGSISNSQRKTSSMSDMLSSVDIDFRLYFGFEFHETRMYTAYIRKQHRT